MATVYKINKGVNRPIEFKGLKGQYIWWLGAGLLILLILFAVLYIAGLNPFLCLGIILILTGILFRQVYRLSRKYGRYGLMKALARRRIPDIIKINSRRVFLDLMKKENPPQA